MLALLPTLFARVQNLKTVIKELLTEFVRANGGTKPSRIIFYRDGVSEGQFQQVTRYDSARPPINILLYTERHTACKLHNFCRSCHSSCDLVKKHQHFHCCCCG